MTYDQARISKLPLRLVIGSVSRQLEITLLARGRGPKQKKENILNLQLIRRAVLRAALIALCITGAGLIRTQPVAGREVQAGTLQGAAALERLKQDGQYESLQAVMNEARPNIEMENSEAAYQQTTNPLFGFQQKLAAADGAPLDSFGWSVAVENDTLVVGAMYDNIDAIPDQGSAYVFTRSGGVWTFQQKLMANDGVPYAYFGNSVAISGDTVVVGAWADDIGANDGQGSAYVFTRSGGVWTQQQKLVANDGAGNDYFGYSVALSGDTVVVGAVGDDTGASTDQGSAYVFTRSGGVWTQQPKLIASDGETGDRFGDAVAISGTTVAVGANSDDFNTNFGQGSVYVFVLSGGVWTLQQKLMANDGEQYDSFGWSVALDGDTLAVGAMNDAIGAKPEQGSAYVFKRSGTDWMQQQKLNASDGAAYDNFGWSVALSGNTLVVGPWRHDVGGNTRQGSAYVFTRDGAVWTEQEKLIASDGAAYDEFGQAVAISGETLAVGAKSKTIGANSVQGAAYVFFRSSPIFTFAPAALPGATMTVWYQQSITASGGAGSYQYTLVSGALPPGLSLREDGLLSGTPTTQGAYSFTIRAIDLNGCFTNRAYTLTVDPPCYPLTIEPPTLDSGMRGVAYNETLTVFDGIAPYTFSKKSGILPSGLRLGFDGVISGTPTQTGNFSFMVQVRDARGCTGSRSYTLTVTRPGI